MSLERTDRLALAVPDAEAARDSFAAIFDTEVIGDERDPLAMARRVTLQWGQDQLELYEPTGEGPVDRFLAAGRTGIFAGGFAVADPGALANRLRDRGIEVHERADGRFVTFPEALNGTGVILSKPEQHDRVGLNDKIWQITYAAPRLNEAVARYSTLFGLDDVFTNYYESDLYGYHGAITWFDARNGGLLDSLEYLAPNDANKAVGRFVKRNGTGIYMASIETEDIAQIKERVTSSGPGWTGTDFGGFIHPKRLHGLLIGLVTYKRWNSQRPLPGR